VPEGADELATHATKGVQTQLAPGIARKPTEDSLRDSQGFVTLDEQGFPIDRFCHLGDYWSPETGPPGSNQAPRFSTRWEQRGDCRTAKSCQVRGTRSHPSTKSVTVRETSTPLSVAGQVAGAFHAEGLLEERARRSGRVRHAWRTRSVRRQLLA